MSPLIGEIRHVCRASRSIIAISVEFLNFCLHSLQASIRKLRQHTAFFVAILPNQFSIHSVIGAVLFHSQKWNTCFGALHISNIADIADLSFA